MKKMRISLVTMMVLLSAVMSAVPAHRHRCLLTLADGKTLAATFRGDEHIHFYQADDGRCFQTDDEDVAHEVDGDSIMAAWTKRQAKAKETLGRRQARMKTNFGKRENPTYGTKRGLVILVEFPDVPFNFSKTDIDPLFNEKNHKDDVNSGSVHDYFYECSYGQFNFTFDVVGPVMMPQPLAYYGKNNTFGNDIRPATMAGEAIRSVAAGLDFHPYDWDDDGEVEQVFIIHSGYDEAQTRVNEQIWSHAWALSEAQQDNDGNGPVMVDGLIIDKYATTAELQGKSGHTLFGIGTACHEFSHCFGLPDTYNTVSQSQFCMDLWDIMDFGEYGGANLNGGTPTAYTAYERMFCGWLKPVVLDEPVYVKDMQPITSAPEAYILYNSGMHDEYYLLENRQFEGFDTYLPGHGMLITHVDFDSDVWKENKVNNVYSHRRMIIIPADNNLSIYNMAGDTWPGTTGNTALTNKTSPAATLYNRNANGNKFLDHEITDIEESADGLISFRFDGATDDDAIRAVKNHTMAPDVFYNTLGQRVSGNYKGLLITEGKTILK